MIGVGAAAWQEGIQLFGVVSTGDIDPVFESVVFESVAPGDRGDASTAAGVSLADVFVNASIIDEKTISISIEGACPGEVFTFKYTIANRGSVPVNFYTCVEKIDTGITFTNSLSEGMLGGNGESVAGELSIRVEDYVEEKTPYTFSLILSFQQWNITP
jgi:hypothetical protein